MSQKKAVELFWSVVLGATIALVIIAVVQAGERWQ